MTKRLKRLLAIHLGFIALLAVYFLVLHFLGITCPLRALINSPCPTCGMTRAFMCLLRLDFKKSFYYHPLLLPFLAAAFLAFHKKTKLLKWMNAKVNDAIVITVAAAILVCYVVRLCLGIIP